ncbi:MAG: PKD domain-containing protein, partial [Chitinophagales bacterium]
NQNYFGEEVETNILNEGSNEILLIVTTDKGCLDTLIDTIEVFPSLLPDFSTNKLCIGDSVFFQDETNSFSITSHLWDFDHNNVFSNEENPSYLYPATEGSFDVSLFVENAIGCENTITKTINIYNPPIAQWIADTFCIGQTEIVADNTISPFDTVIQWQWIAQGDTFDSQNINLLYNDIGDFPISLSVVTENGCEDDTTTNVSVQGTPNVDFSFSPNYGTAPIDIQFINETDDATSFEWEFGDENGSSTEENPLYTYNDNGIYNITL